MYKIKFMSKRKNKTNTATPLNVQKAKHRNDYIALFKHWVDTLSERKVSQLIPKSEYDNIFNLRMHPVLLLNNPLNPLPKKEFEQFKKFNTQLLQCNDIDFELDNGIKLKVSFYDFFTFGLSVNHYIINLDSTRYEGAEDVKAAFAPTADGIRDQIYSFVCEYYHKILFTLTILYSTLQNYYIAYRFDFVTQLDGKISPRFFVDLSTLILNRINILVDNHHRPAYQLGDIALHEKKPFIKNIIITAQQLGLNGNQSYGVYIQSHAINRLKERLDCISEGILHRYVLVSINNLKYCKTKDGSYLFEYVLVDKKVGYFKGDIIDDKILLRTFLFLTNNNTPEGQKLHANTGILKEDKIYLAIDKLSTFMHSDISTNERLKQLFIEADCGGLFNIDKYLNFADADVKEKAIASFIEKYLKLDTLAPRMS
jgi:hypothetical protein